MKMEEKERITKNEAPPGGFFKVGSTGLNWVEPSSFGSSEIHRDKNGLKWVKNGFPSQHGFFCQGFSSGFDWVELSWTEFIWF